MRDPIRASSVSIMPASSSLGNSIITRKFHRTNRGVSWRGDKRATERKGKKESSPRPSTVDRVANLYFPEIELSSNLELTNEI